MLTAGNPVQRLFTTLKRIVGIGVFACFAYSLQSAPGFQLGANVNENLTRLDPVLLDRSQTTWVRGFVPASAFISGRRQLAADPGLQTLKQAAASGRKVILSIKWDLKRAGWRVPEPDSETERRWIDWVNALLEEMNGQVSMLALINELFIDTPPADLEPDPAGRILMVEFLERLAVSVHSRHWKDAQGNPLPLYCGGLTRLDTAKMQAAPATLAMLQWCASDKRIAGVNFHLHERNYGQFTKALKFIRSRVPAKPLIVPEFSLIAQYRAHLADRLDGTEAGAAFASRHNIASDCTVREFINDCIRSPVPERQWQEFLHSQAWFDPGFLQKSCDLMAAHGVIVATYAFSQLGSGGRHLLRAGDSPWLLNPIFVPVTAYAENTDMTAIMPDFFNEYLRRQKEEHRSESVPSENLERQLGKPHDK